MQQIKKQKQYSFAAYIIFLCLIFGLAGALVWFYKHEKQELNITDLTKTSVHLKWQHNAQFAGMYVANANDLYKDSGLAVDFLETTGEEDSGTEAILSGKADFAVVSAGELLDDVENNKPIKAVAAIYQNTPAVYGFLADSNIKTPSDLANKVLGTPNRSKYPMIFYKILTSKYKIPSNLISFKSTGYTPIISLRDKKVDAAIFYRGEGAYMAKYRKVNVNTFKPEDHGIFLYDDIIITTDKKISENPDQVEKFVKATLEGWQKVLENPDDAITDTLPYTSGQYKDIDLEKEILQQNLPLLTDNDKVAVGTMTAKKWQDIYAMYSRNILTTSVDFTKTYDLNFF